MKKLYILLFTFLISSVSFGQGTETFDGLTATGTSYSDGTFTGQDGSTWTYVQSRGDQTITGKALMLGRNRTPQAQLYSGTISGGVGTISFNYAQTFSTNVNLNVLVNGIVVGNVTSSGEAAITKASGTITVNQPGDVVIKFISVNNSDGQVTIDDITWTGYTGTATPAIAITSPSDNSIYPSGTTSVDVAFTTANTNTGDQVNITVNGGTPNTNVTSPFSVSTTDGTSYSVLVELVDSGSSVLDSQTVNFEVLYPCNLQIGTISTVCDAITSGTDTYTTSIAFTGGMTSQYTIDTGGMGTVGGDNPSNVATGTITITGVNEGSNFTITFTGNPADSSCNISRNITAPVCIPATCANPGDIIITEIMQNPSINADPAGEYIELYNTTSSPIDIKGWVIKDDATASESHTISTTLIIPANGYMVVGNAATPNGGVTMNYTYANDISLGNSGDGIILECSSIVIDQVIWDGSFPFSSGVAMELSTTTLDATSNDSAANWGAATSTFGDGDKGTPGSANDFTLSTKYNQIENFTMYPNPTNLGFVNISSKSNAKMAVSVFDILGKQVLNETISNNVLNVSKLNAGIYVMKVQQDNAITTKKLVIE